MSSTDYAAPTRASPPTPVTRRWAFLVIISASLLLIGIDNSVFYTALPVLREQLHTTELKGLRIINTYPLAIPALLLGTGTPDDRIGHRKMFLVGPIIFDFSPLAAAFAPYAWALVIARGCLELGTAIMMPATLTLLHETFHHPRELATAIGIRSAAATLGAAAGPVVGGFLLEHLWWGSIFFINIPVTAFAIIGTLILAPPNQPNAAKRWGFLTSLYAMLAMLGLVSLIRELAGHRSSTVIVATITCGLVGVVLFQRCQARLIELLTDFSVFCSPMFSGGVLAVVLAMFVLAGAELVTTQRFQIPVGYAPLDVGLLVTIAVLVSLPVGVIGGMVLHRAGFRIPITGGFLLNAVGLAGMYYGVSSGNFPLMVVGLILLGAGAGSVMSASSTVIIGSAPRSKAGMAAAMESISYEFGTLITVVITGSLLLMFYTLFTPVDATISPTDALYTPALNNGARADPDSSYLAILIILAIVAIIAAIATAVTFRGNPKETEYAHE